MFPQFRRIESLAMALETSHRPLQGCAGRLVEENARSISLATGGISSGQGNHGLEASPASQRDHRPPAGVRLERNDAEILERRVHESRRALVRGSQLLRLE